MYDKVTLNCKAQSHVDTLEKIIVLLNIFVGACKSTYNSKLKIIILLWEYLFKCSTYKGKKGWNTI